MLLVLLLGIADFGRVFAAGIAIESSARNAAEAVAQEYLRNPPGPMADPAPLPGDDAYYKALHELAARTACREARSLPGVSYVPDDSGTTADEESCGTMPIIRTCIHDTADTRCGDVAFGAAVPDSCTVLMEPMNPSMDGGAETSRYVEVRVCYRFTTLINITDMQLPFGWGISVGEIWLEKDRVFGVGYYPPPPTPEPPPPPPPPPPTAAPCFVPIAAFSANPSSGASPLDVLFTDASTEVDCPILTRSWDFGDGSPLSGLQNPQHTFTHSGTGPSTDYLVTLTVASAAGPDQATQVITVGPDPCEVPVVTFAAEPGSGQSPLVVQFTDTTTPVGCPIDSWSWDFGDGSPPSTAQNPQHTFANPGTEPKDYTVTLTATSAAGDAQATVVITVGAAP